MKKEYHLPFLEALDELIDGAWVRGQNFKDGAYLKLSQGILTIVDTNSPYNQREFQKVSILALKDQKFRVVVSETVNELTG